MFQDKLIDERKLMKSVTLYFVRHYPEQQSLLTKRMLRETRIFANGFLSCLKSMGEEPMPKKEINELLVQESLNFIKKEYKLPY